MADTNPAAAKLWLKRQTKQGRRDAAPVVILGLATIVLAIGQAWCVAKVLGWAIGGPAAGPGFGPLTYVIWYAALAAVRALLGVWSERAAAGAGASARRRLRDEAMARLLAAGPALLRRHHSAELASTAVDRIEALEGLFARWAPAAVLAIAGPAVVALAAVSVDWVAAAVLAGAGLLVPLAMALSGIGAAVASRRQFLALSRLQTRFLDRVRGIATIVLHGRAGDEARALADAADELRRRTMRVLRVAFLSSAALDLAMAAALVGLALHYGLSATHGGLTTAQALFMLLLVPEFFAPLRAFSAAYQDRMHAHGAAEALAVIPPLPEPAVPLPIRTIEARGVTVAFEHVDLIWDAARGKALEDVSFRVPAGETLVLAGPSGSGKSSILEVLLGFVPPAAGHVTLNGMDIAGIVPAALGRLTAWIGQKPVLFAGTIRENILFAKPEASALEVAEAAHLARVDVFAAELPDGLDTLVGEGGYGLSGGQAQRVAIARAFLKNAPLLLLDEPTGHLDPATEGEVLDSLKRLALGRTVILASHTAAVHTFGGRRLDLREGRAQEALRATA